LKRKYVVDGKSSEIVLFLMENSMQGRSKMIVDGILDIG
jgi:hypothetical protein